MHFFAFFAQKGAQKSRGAPPRTPGAHLTPRHTWYPPRPARCRPKTIFRLWCQLLKLSQSDINCVECGDEVHAFSLHTQLQKFSSRGSAPHPSWSNGTCGPWTNEHCENFCVTEICNRHRIWPTLSAGPDPARATPRPPPMGRGGAVSDLLVTKGGCYPQTHRRRVRGRLPIASGT